MDTGRKNGRGNLPEWGLIAMAVALFLVTGYRSWHFLTTSLPDEYQIIAYAGLFGLDVGAIIWALLWMRASTSTAQDEIALGMFVVDVIGMLFTSITDALLYQQGVRVEMPQALKTAALYGVPTIVAANAVAGVLYHMASESTALRRKARRDEAELEAMRAAIRQERAYLDQLELLLMEKEKLAAQGLRARAIERGLAMADRAGTHVDDAAISIASRVQRTFSSHPTIGISQPAGITQPAVMVHGNGGGGGGLQRPHPGTGPVSEEPKNP
jgi:hypothetical protein